MQNRIPLGPKIKCPKCQMSNLNAHQTSQGVQIVCKKCKTLMYGFQNQQQQAPPVTEQIVNEIVDSSLKVGVPNENNRENKPGNTGSQ